MNRVRRLSTGQLAWILTAGVAAAGAAIVPESAATAVRFAAWSLLEMAPVIAAAVLLSALVRASGADGLLSRAFAKRGSTAIVLSATLGAITPICGVGVLPIVAGLLGAGVPLAAVMAFWLASPVTDPGMVAITAGTLGLPFAVGKTVFAGLIGIAGGTATAALVRAGAFETPLKGRARQASEAAGAERGLMLRFWEESDRRALFRRDAQDAAALILKWLTVAFLLEGLLREHLPAELVAEVVGRSNDWAIPLAVGLGAPIYLDGYAALPLVRGLMDLGMTPGAAMAFLIAGGVTSLYASVAVFALVRPAVFAWYLALAVVLSLATGYVWELIAPLAHS
ncbi:MAG: permease [Alphaproteobacteria bacterium]